uniref:Uncharacterized protein n=1 Tax=Candidatus Kentrum sp. LPFa TaxID=2126335 RepID=A0A450XMU3_9GAMM|nr:MAG: hypothetical protein BECKLPF1236A_GA0070988_108271 [Candidatus Kentron sp. LPFa]
MSAFLPPFPMSGFASRTFQWRLFSEARVLTEAQIEPWVPVCFLCFRLVPRRCHNIGVCQDSCPVTFTMIYKLYSLARISLGGLSHTSFTGFQFLVLPDQRSGFFALVAS